MSESQNDSKMRIVRRITDYGYEEIDFMELKKGDIFTLTNPDGTPVKFKESIIFDALGDPYVNSNGVGEIHMKDYMPLVLH
jgi:hypothetical protein